jgi:hypothetical protein
MVVSVSAKFAISRNILDKKIPVIITCIIKSSGSSNSAYSYSFNRIACRGSLRELYHADSLLR